MSGRLAEIADGPVDVVLITFTTAAELDGYRDRRDPGFPVLLDPDRASYRAYGLAGGSLLDVWGWKTVQRYASILKPSGPGRGLADLGAATEDTRQLGGDFVIAADGRLAWGYWSTGPADRPTVDEIAGAVRAASQVERSRDRGTEQSRDREIER